MATDSLETIAAILNKAENTNSEAERNTFMEAAQRKAARIGVDLAMAQQHTKTQQEKAGKPITKRVPCGEKGDFRRQRYAELLYKIGNVNDLREWIDGAGHWVELTGLKSDIEMTELMYGSLLFQMVSECQEYLASGEWKESAKTVHSARDSFYHGFIDAVIPRLWSAKRDAMAEAERDYQEHGESTALVLKNKRQEVNDAYRELHPTIRRARLSGLDYHPGSARQGRSSGKNANITGRQSLGTGKQKLG